MKKIITLVVVVSTTSTLLNAQNISIGPTAGFGHSWITNYSDKTKFNATWNAGLSFIYSTKTNFGIGADLKYSAEGIKNEYTVEGPADGLITVTNTLNANYIRIPFKLIYFLGKYGNAVRPKLYIGPDFGFFVGGKSVFDYGNVKYDTKEFIKGFDLGGIVAAGLNFRLAPATWLNTDIAYYNGFTNVSKDDNNNHNKNLQLNIGLLVSLKKK